MLGWDWGIVIGCCSYGIALLTLLQEQQRIATSTGLQRIHNSQSVRSETPPLLNPVAVRSAVCVCVCVFAIGELLLLGLISKV